MPRIDEIKGQECRPGKKIVSGSGTAMFPGLHEKDIGFNACHDAHSKIVVDIDVEELARILSEKAYVSNGWEYPGWNKIKKFHNHYIKEAKAIAQNASKFLVLRKGE